MLKMSVALVLVENDSCIHPLQALNEARLRHERALESALSGMAAKYEGEAQEAERRHKEALARLADLCAASFAEERERLEIGTSGFDCVALTLPRPVLPQA